MSSDAPTRDPDTGQTRRSTTTSRLRNRLTAGIILVVPIWICLLLLRFVFGMMRDASLWIVKALLKSPWTEAVRDYTGLTNIAAEDGSFESLPFAVRFVLAALSVMLTIALLYVLGMTTTNIVGRRLLRGVETMVDRVPIVKTIYHASKQVLQTFAGESGQSFQRVVSVPFPNANVRTIGFVTRVITNPDSGVESCAVFVATAPNPTTGFVLLVERRELIDLDWSVEEALKVIMSGGVLMAGPAHVDLPAEQGRDATP